MIKKLRTKFVCIMMTLVVIMLVIIFGLVIVFMSLGLEIQSQRMLDALADSPMQMGDRYDIPDDIRAPFFIIQISARGEIAAAGYSFYNLSDEVTVQELIAQSRESGQQEGVLELYDLRYKRVSRPMGETIIFLDISSQRSTIRSLVTSCVLIGCVSTGVFFAISLLLANWAVAPVEQAWQQQKQFVADASHELKTPLAVIMTNAELLQNPEYGEEDRQQFSGSIFTMSQQMRGLVEGLLELARVDNGAVKMAFSAVNFSELVADGILPFEPLFFERDLQLYSHVEEDITLTGSGGHLKQVLDILLDNALKYAAEQSAVYVRLTRQGSGCLLSVASAGASISPQDMQKIFRRFYRVDSARSRDGSYGLGLSIAQSIVEEHRGKIWAESDKGINTFYVQLPNK